MRIRLSDHFSYAKLIKFTLPSIAMMIFTSIYGVVDGFFVSNFAGKTPFAAVNFIMPFLMILATVGFMFGTGGTAIVAKTFGEGDSKLANARFSLFVYSAGALGVIFAVLGIVFIRPIAAWLGATGAQALFRVKLPMVMPSITICTFLTLTNSFKLFDQNLSLTGGEPAKASQMLALNIYDTFYQRSGAQWKGIGQAKAVVFFLLVIVIALIQLYFTRRKEVQQ